MTIEPRRSNQPDALRLDPEGNWFQGEYPILHERTIKYLQKHIVVRENGDFYFEGEDKPILIIVEDAPFWVVKIEKTIAGFLITLTDESIELMDPESLWVGKEGTLYCRVKGDLVARFQRQSYYEITRFFEQKGGRFYLNIGKKSYLVGTKPPADLEKKQKEANKKILKEQKRVAKKASDKKKAKADRASAKQVAKKAPVKKTAVKKAPAKKVAAKKPAKKIKKK